MVNGLEYDFPGDLTPDGVVEDIPRDLSSLQSFDWYEFLLTLAKKGVNACVTLIIALLLLLIGWLIIKLVMFLLRKALKARKSMDPTLQGWTLSVVGTALKVFLIIIFIDFLGIETLSIAGMIAAIGVAIGTALSGIVQNFAAGLIIIALKPIKVGEWIKVAGVDGSVTEIHVCTTTLTTFDNKVHIVPNVVLVNNPITNFSRQPVCRVDIVLAVPITQDVDFASKCIVDALYSCTSDNKVLEDPRASVSVSAIDGGFCYLCVCSFIDNVSPGNFVRCLWHFKETIIRTLKKEGIPGALPCLHIYLHEGDPKAAMTPPTAEEQIEELKHRLNSHSRNASGQPNSAAAILAIDEAEQAEKAKEKEEENKAIAEDEDKDKAGESKSHKHKHKDKKN